MKNFTMNQTRIFIWIAVFACQAMNIYSQNIGIGTSSPTDKLHIYSGDLRIEDNNSPFVILNSLTAGLNSGINFKQNNTSNGWLYFDDTDDVMRISTQVAGDRDDFVVNTVGNVGIGTGSPSTKFHVSAGDITFDDVNPFFYIKSTVVDTNLGISFKEINSTKGWIFYDSFEELFRISASSTGNRNDLVINSSGNLGVGTASPTSKFHVAGGDITSENTSAFLYMNATAATGNAGINFKQAGNIKGWIYYSDASDILRFSTELVGNRNDLVVAMDGKIGIGTGTPGLHQLYVTSSGTGATGATGYFINSASAGIAFSLENSNYSSSDNVLLVTTRGFDADIASFDSYHGWGGGWDREFRFTNSGDGRCDGSWIGGGADYAEFFNKADTKEIIQPGDVIAMSPDLGYSVVKADNLKSQLVLGVYSTNPVVVGNSSAEEDPENAVLVGLMGVVPTKVSNENGPIRIGDFLSSSSIAGVAARAVTSGMVIGRAMENYNEMSPGMIKVMVDVCWVNLDTFSEIELLKTEIQELRTMISELDNRP